MDVLNPISPLDWMHRAPHASGMDRIEAYFAGFAFDPHRHDTYAIGRTLFGVQSFHYRGCMTHSLPGTTMVIHPDETHDGFAAALHWRGTGAGLSYVRTE